MSGGITLCPHCGTRFRITAEQLLSHHGMVRCGHCMQAFDARPSFAPDLPEMQSAPEAPEARETAEAPEPPLEPGPTPAIETETIETEATAATVDTALVAEPATAHDLAQETIYFNELYEAPPNRMPDRFAPPPQRAWAWAIGAVLLLCVLLAQAGYFFRIELAARMPGLKPALVNYCALLGCSIPLPQNSDLMSIESSALEADPANESQINLSAQLRNRAGYAQAFPNLELTLNDSQDKPLARRTFRPSEYLPPGESETNGLQPNRDVNIKLRLDISDIKPTGYRLAFFYPAN